jgi:hypothetical protein
MRLSEVGAAMRVLLDAGGAIGTTDPNCEVFEVAGAGSGDGDGMLWVGVQDREAVTEAVQAAAGVLVTDWLERRLGSLAGNGRIT